MCTLTPYCFYNKICSFITKYVLLSLRIFHEVAIVSGQRFKLLVQKILFDLRPTPWTSQGNELQQTLNRTMTGLF